MPLASGLEADCTQIVKSLYLRAAAHRKEPPMPDIVDAELCEDTIFRNFPPFLMLSSR
jgi:hypothetical protein